MLEKISVVGLGIFGTVNANMIAENGYNVVGYTKDDYANEVNIHHTNNKYFEKHNLKDFRLSNNLIATNNLRESIENSSFVLLVLPSSVIAEVVGEIKKLQDVNFEKNFVQ